MSLIWIRFRLFLVISLFLFTIVMSGCPGPGDPIFGACGSCTDCNPKTTFPGGVITTSAGSYKLFDKGRVEYGCIGVTWEGQKDNPPAYIAKLKADGSYEVFNPATRSFLAENIVATVAPGVDKIDALFFVLKSTEKEALQIDCANIVKGGVGPCLQQGTCLFAWKVEKTSAIGAGGTCKLCRREICDGKDNNCDDKGEADENGACGTLFNTLGCNSHKSKVVDANTPGCDPKGSCSCLVTSDQKVYVCAAPEEGKAKWTLLETVTTQCKTAADTTANPQKKYFCAGERLICDTCPNQPVGWRTTKGCSDGVMVLKK